MVPAVDCRQLDVTRCGGYTGWLRCADLANAAGVYVSGHCAPSLHAPVVAALPWLRHVEWFVDHARLEPCLVDGAPTVTDGALLVPDSPGTAWSCGRTRSAGARADRRLPAPQSPARHTAPSPGRLTR
jgi:L-alanine-DL-glutamate epimerase-like enolase superfamily enzyme